MNIRNLIIDSFQDATKQAQTAVTKRELHRARSQAWIESLAKHLNDHYRLNSHYKDTRVFSRYDKSNRKEFGVNELLYDILVVTIKIIKSAKQKKNLSVINEVLWQIESEFAPDSQQALYDFNKLILGSGKHKLFIGPQVSNNQAFIDSLLPAAQACLNNDVYIALVPHPADWETEKKNIDTWIYDRDQNRWKALL